MIRKQFILSCIVSTLSFSSLAQESELNIQLIPKQIVPREEILEEGELLILRINCYTNAQDCYGRAYFKNQDRNRYVSVAVFYNNGASGRTNTNESSPGYAGEAAGV